MSKGCSFLGVMDDHIGPLEDYAGSSSEHLCGYIDVCPAPALSKKQQKQRLSISSPEKVCISNII
jgi:hypothetical protein